MFSMKSKQTISSNQSALAWIALCSAKQTFSQPVVSTLTTLLLFLPLSGCTDVTDTLADANTLTQQEAPTGSQEATNSGPETEAAESDPKQAEEKTDGEESKAVPEPAKESDADGSGANKRTGKMVSADEAQLNESERRLQSLAKSFQKEERPEKPNFDGRAVKNGAITFDDLKFEMKKSDRFKRTMLTKSVNEMVGERLQIKGFMHPNSRKRKIEKFIFVRDDKECCFGPSAALYDCMLVSLAEGEKGKFSTRPVTVEGEFYLDEFDGPDGRVWAIYRLKNGVIKN